MESSSSFVATKSSQMKKQPHDFKVVVHNNYKKKQTSKTTDSKPEEKEPSPLDMKKTRFEIYKFSKSDLSFSNRQKSNVELAIQLGAKPPKNVAKNYKQLIEEKRNEASKKKEENFMKQISINYRSMMADKKKKNSNKMLKPKSNQQGILGIYGKVSFFFI